MASRFLTLDGVGEVLAVSRSQAYALVRRGDLRAIKVGGRGLWRVERAELEAFIAAAYLAGENVAGENAAGEGTGAPDDGGENPDGADGAGGRPRDQPDQGAAGP